MNTYYGTNGADAKNASNANMDLFLGKYDAMYGGGGDDFLSSQLDGPVYAEGGTGDDSLAISALAMNGSVTLYGGDGGDLLIGSISNNLDRLYGGAGDDALIASVPDIPAVGPSLAEGGGGRDALYSGLGNDTLFGGDGDESGMITVPFYAIAAGLYGGQGSDWLDGGNGNDFLDGGAGIDVLIGGFGNDTIVVDRAGDQVFEAPGGGVDTVRVAKNTTMDLVNGNFVEVVTLPVGTFALSAHAEVENFLADDPALATALNLTGSAFANQITGNAGKNTLLGLSGDDGLFGLLGNDKLDGGTGHDKLDGRAGNDSLKGGTGKDTLTGGSGKDTFVFNTAPNKSTNVDAITDFRWQDDTFHLDNAVLKKVGSGGKLKADAFHLGKKAADAEDRIVYDKGTGSLYYDADGTGKTAAIKLAVLKDKATLKLSDFFVI